VRTSLTEETPGYVQGNTALMYAAAGGHVECANVVLEYGANANVRSEADSDTPMHKAVREGHMQVVVLLLKHRADLAVSPPPAPPPVQHSSPQNIYRSSSRARRVALIC